VIINFGEESESDTDDEELKFSEILAEKMIILIIFIIFIIIVKNYFKE
jgi:hypothetical protein